MKKFDEFINEDKEFHYFDHIEIVDYISNVLGKKLKDLEVGNEGTTVTSASSGNDIPNIGKRSDYELEDGSYSHAIIGVRLFYGNGDFVGAFSNMSDFGKHIVNVEDTIKETFDVEKISKYGEYFCYLIPITDEIRNAAKSTERIKKFDL